MAKRMREQKGEERSVAKSKSAAMNLSSHVPTSSSSAKSPIASKSMEILIAVVKLESRMRRHSKSDAASSSQTRLKDSYHGGSMDTATGKLVATKEDSGNVDLSESEEEAVTGETHCLSNSYGETQMHPVNQTTREVQKLNEKNGHTIYTIHHTEAVFSIVRNIYGREHDDTMNDLDVNMAVWGIFLNTTLHAAVLNLRFVKKHLWNSVGPLFIETGKLISEQTEITGANTINFKEVTWMSTCLLCSRAYHVTNAKTHFFSDSVLCVGKMGDDPIETWKSKIKWYSETYHFKDLNRIDGMPTEFEWKKKPGITALSLLEKIQSLLRDLQ